MALGAETEPLQPVWEMFPPNPSNLFVYQCLQFHSAWQKHSCHGRGLVIVHVRSLFLLH